MSNLQKYVKVGPFRPGLPYTWLESSGNEDSDAIFPKSLGGNSKRPDFCDGRGREV